MIEINFIGLAISMVLLLAFITPIVLNVRKNNKIQKALLVQLQNAALNNGLNIQKMETWRNRYALALDTVAHKLIYINNGANPKEVYIDLNEMDVASIHEKHHIVGSGKESYKVIDNLDLNITGSYQQHYNLCFYDSDIFSDLQNEKPLLEEWHLQIQRLIHNKPERKTPVLA